MHLGFFFLLEGSIYIHINIFVQCCVDYDTTCTRLDLVVQIIFLSLGIHLLSVNTVHSVCYSPALLASLSPQCPHVKCRCGGIGAAAGPNLAMTSSASGSSVPTAARSGGSDPTRAVSLPPLLPQWRPEPHMRISWRNTPSGKCLFRRPASPGLMETCSMYGVITHARDLAWDRLRRASSEASS